MCQEIYTFIYSMKCSLSVYYILGTEKAKDISMQLPSSENLWRIKREDVAVLSAVTPSGHLNPGSLKNKLGPSQGEVHGNKEGKD